MKYQLIWLNLVEKLLPTGLYDHGMIKDDQTSTIRTVELNLKFENLKIELLAQKYQDEFSQKK